MDDAEYGRGYDGEAAMGFVKKEVSGFGEWRGEKGHQEGEAVIRDNFFGVSTTAGEQRSPEGTGRLLLWVQEFCLSFAFQGSG